MTVAVMFSGGADSTVLLHHVLSETKDIVAVYVDFENDKINPDREKNLEHVTKYCRDLIVQLVIITEPDVKKDKGPEGDARIGLLSARKWAEENYDRVYIGHNKDDHIETILIQLFRGAGRGSKGIPDKVSGKVYRPLLDYTKKEILEICNREGYSYIHDKSNDNTTMTRAFWRHEIIPKLIEHYGEKGTYTRIKMIGKNYE